MDPKIVLVGVGFLAAIEPAVDPSIGPICEPREMCAPLPNTAGDEPAPKTPEPLGTRITITSSVSTVDLSARSMIMIKAADNLLVTEIRKDLPMDQRIAFFDVMAWNPATADFDRWLGTATRDAIAKLSDGVRVGPLIGYEAASKHPSGWGYRAA